MVAQALGGAAAGGADLWRGRRVVAVGHRSRPLAFDLGLVAWLGVATAAVLAPLAIYAAVREP